MRRKIPDIYIPIGNLPKFKGILSKDNSFKSFVMTQLVKSLQNSIGKNIILFEINSTGDCISIPKNEIPKAIDSALVYFEELEDYEKCDKLLKIKTSLYGK